METPTSKQEENQDPFLQRAVEYWLDASNELGYQPLFCEWLIFQGYILKYSIKNTHFEQGKDVVAVSSSGVPCAYQLKGGNINLKRWREEVKPEIEALIGCAIQHPDIDKSTQHISYLVTNGEIEDNVRVEIVALNEKQWKDTPLHVWTRGDLLNGFQKMADGILPKDAYTYKQLIDLIFADGTGFPDISKINSFLHEILRIDNVTVKKEQRKRDIAATMLYTTMIVGPYRRTENHGSIVRIMVLLLSFIFHLVDKYSLEDKYWYETYEIIWSDIFLTAQLLETEVNTKGFESSFLTPFDKELIPFRKHSAISVIYPLKLSQFILRNEKWKTIFDPEVIKKYKQVVAVWGEASLIPFIILSLILKNTETEKKTAVNLAQAGLTKILENNGRKSKNSMGLIPPYYDLDFAVQASFGLAEKIEEQYKMSSYLIRPFIDILVRLDQRDIITENWREISFIHFEEFILSQPTDYYLWRTTNGENRTTTAKKEQSWIQLVTESNSFTGTTLPNTMKRFPEFIPFFLSIFPHRVNSEIVGFLSKITDEIISDNLPATK
jgi:hypothetical protein